MLKEKLADCLSVNLEHGIQEKFNRKKYTKEPLEDINKLLTKANHLYQQLMDNKL